jgi:hypothetical protein
VTNFKDNDYRGMNQREQRYDHETRQRAGDLDPWAKGKLIVEDGIHVK